MRLASEEPIDDLDLDVLISDDEHLLDNERKVMETDEFMQWTPLDPVISRNDYQFEVNPSAEAHATIITCDLDRREGYVKCFDTTLYFFNSSKHELPKEAYRVCYVSTVKEQLVPTSMKSFYEGIVLEWNAFSLIVVFTPKTIFFLTLKRMETAKTIVEAYQRSLQEVYDAQHWIEKERRFQDSIVTALESLSDSYQKIYRLSSALESTGMLDSWNPLSLSIQRGYVTIDGERQYAALHGMQLYIFSNKAEKIPTGTVSLKNCDIEFLDESLNKGIHMFYIITVDRRLECVAETRIALANWIWSLKKALDKNSENFLSVLTSIVQNQRPFECAKVMLSIKEAVHVFREFWNENMDSSEVDYVLTALDTWFEIELMKSYKKLDTSEKLQHAFKIFDSFYSLPLEDDLRNHCIEEYDKLLYTIRPKRVFEDLKQFLLEYLDEMLEIFRESDYAAHEERVQSRELISNVFFDAFAHPDSCIGLKLSYRDISKFYEFDFNKAEIRVGSSAHVCTVQIASRAIAPIHGYFDFSPIHCVYRDAGTELGTFMGEERIDYVMLNIGDKIRIGEFVLELSIKQKENFLQNLRSLLK